MKKIQAEIAILNLNTPIYNDMLCEVFLGALKDEPYASIIFQINSEISDPQIDTILHQLKEQEMEENSNKTAIKNAAANPAQAPAAGGKNKEGKPGKTCFQCQRKGHFASKCYTMKLKDREELPPNGVKPPPKSKASARQANKSLNPQENSKKLSTQDNEANIDG